MKANKKIIFASMLGFLTCQSFAGELSKNVIDREIKQLQENGCSVNVNGTISVEQEDGSSKVLIPYIDCNGDGKFQVKALTIDNNGNTNAAGDTSIEKIVDYDGMASVTEKIEYIAPKIIKTNPNLSPEEKINTRL